MPMGAMPRLFMAVAQAVGSDIGNPIRMGRKQNLTSKREKTLT